MAPLNTDLGDVHAVIRGFLRGSQEGSYHTHLNVPQLTALRSLINNNIDVSARKTGGEYHDGDPRTRQRQTLADGIVTLNEAGPTARLPDDDPKEGSDDQESGDGSQSDHLHVKVARPSI